MTHLYNQNIYKTRFSSEIMNVLTKYNNIKIEISENKKIVMNVNIQNYNISLELDYYYPFTEPIVLIDNDFISDFYKLPSNRMYQNLADNNLSSNCCFHCSSIISKRNWSPVRKVVDIIEEINNIINIKKKIYFSILINKIKTKYLIDDINIFKYLFN